MHVNQQVFSQDDAIYCSMIEPVDMRAGVGPVVVRSDVLMDDQASMGLLQLACAILEVKFVPKKGHKPGIKELLSFFWGQVLHFMG